MDKEHSELIAVSDLRIGMFVELGIGWMSHPFPTGSFRISSVRQIDTIRALGLAQVRHFPHRGEHAAGQHAERRVTVSVGVAALAPVAAARPHPEPASRPASVSVVTPPVRAQSVSELQTQESQRQARCERRFQESAALYKNVLEQVHIQPQQVRAQCDAMLAGLLEDLLRPGEVSIRLLSGSGGGRAGAHAANVTVLALLLGKSLGLAREELQKLGLAAFLHDIGKSLLPERVRFFDAYFSVAEYKMYQDHVLRSVELGQTLGLPRDALMAVAQHHELLDGGGFPRKSKGEALGRLGRILAVVNRFDNLCNPVHLATALTPHEALSSIYSQAQGRFDGVVVSALIRMLGVYPPGTVIQLSNDRFALVLAANTARSLKPRVLVHDPRVPRHEAAVLDMEQTPGLAIRRGVKPAHLSLDSADYLAPRQRVCYFIDHPQDARLAA